MNPTPTPPRHPRHRLGQFPTPLHRLSRLEQALGGGEVWVKRDDLAGFALAGNKTRPLEFLVADALRSGAEVVVSGGAPKSNFAAALAGAAQTAGLACELMLPDGPPTDPPPAMRLAVASGAALHFTGGDREALDEVIEEHAQKLTAQGRRAYAVPRGGATAIGSLGFAAAAFELAEQGLADDATVVLPVGSGASVAGLVAGRSALGAGWTITGVSVSRPIAEMREHVASLAAACAQLMGTPTPESAPGVEIVDATDPGMAAVTAEERAAAALAYRTEGLLLDPHYGVKALQHVVELVRQGHRGPIVLWHTGGLASAIPLALAQVEEPDGRTR